MSTFPFFEQGAFHIPQNASPEEIKRRREALKKTKYGSAKYVGEGLGHLATGIMAGKMNRKLDAAERSGRESASALFSSLIRGDGVPTPSSGTGPMTVLGVPPTKEKSVANDTMAALVRTGLIDRGMPEHIADGFVMNFQDESGMNPGINEHSPVVPGSRGGFGLAQWTGPRRVALENYAASVGKPVDDMNMQLDFLMQELQGSERSAAEKIYSASDAGSAGAAVVNHFLRPAEEHRSRREARYTGGRPQVVSARNAAPAQGGSLPALYAALANPWLDQSQKAVITQMISQQQQAADPLRQLQLEKARIDIENARNPKPKVTDDMAEYNQAVTQGYEGTFFDYQRDLKKAGSTSVINSVRTGDETGRYLYGTKAGLPNGWRLDTQTGMASRIPGGPDDAEATAANSAIVNNGHSALTLIDSIMNDPALGEVTGKFQGRIDPNGMGGLIMSQDALNLLPKIEQLSGKAFLDAFEKLKGGGQITEREGQEAKNASARLQRYQDDASYMAALKDLRDSVERGILRAQGIDVPEFADPAEYRVDGKGLAPQVAADDFPDVSAMSASEISKMMKERPSQDWTDEQRKAVAARLRELREQR